MSQTTPQPAPEVLPSAPLVAETETSVESIAAPPSSPSEAFETAAEDEAAEYPTESTEALATTTAPALDPAALNSVEPAELPAPDATSTIPTRVDDAVPASLTELATWKLSCEWSMAVALQAKGQTAQRFGKHLEAARQEAQLLGVALPELPDQAEESAQLEVGLKYLLEDEGPQLAEQLNEKFGVEQAALAELAAKTHVLLLSYVPSSTRLEPVVAAIERSAANSGLPQSVWSELTDLLTRRASFQEVKAAIFRLHEEVTAHLTGSAAGAERD